MPNQSVQFFLLSFGIIAILLLAGFNINTHFNQQKVLGTKDNLSKLLEKKTFWEDITAQHPSYIDGWLELAKVAFELENYDYAEGALNSAKAIDPNSEKVEKFETELGL